MSSPRCVKCGPRRDRDAAPGLATAAGASESFIVLPASTASTAAAAAATTTKTTRKAMKNKKTTTRTRAAPAEARVSADVVRERRLLSVALDCRPDNDPCDDPELAMLRPRVTSMHAYLQEEGALAQKRSRGGDPARTALCEDCFAFVQAHLRRDAAEDMRLLAQVQQFDRVQLRPPLRPASRRPAPQSALQPAARRRQDKWQTLRGAQGRRDSATSAAAADDADVDDAEAVERELRALLAEQEGLAAELGELERQRAEARSRRQRLDEEEWELMRMEQRFVAEAAGTAAMLGVVAEKRDSLLSRIRRTKRMVRELKPVHAFNDAFFVWRDGAYGSINGFRLGQLLTAAPGSGGGGGPAASNSSNSNSNSNGNGNGNGNGNSSAGSVQQQKEPPGWEEVNTAWGLSAMLLAAIAANKGFEFQGFRIAPMGARTSIVRLCTAASALDFLNPLAAARQRQQARLPLYLDVDSAGSVLDRVRLLGSSAEAGFNNAMRAFVICLNQLAVVAVSSDSGKGIDLAKKMYDMDVPDPAAWQQRIIPPGSCLINGDSVDIMHNPLGAGTAEGAGGAGAGARRTPSETDVANAQRWTVAMRHVLTNLKWLLVWSVRSHSGTSSSSSSPS